MSEQMNEKRLNDYDNHWINIYSELGERYENLPSLQSMPYVAVRLLAMRHGLNALMKALVERGTAWVAAQARHELSVRQQFVARMIVEYPPQSQEEIEGAVQEMAGDLAAIDCPEGGMRMLKYVDRLRRRELALNAISNRTMH